MQRLKFLLLALALVVVTGDDARAQGLQRITVYIQNPTSGAIPFTYKKGGDDWYQCKIQPGYTMTMTGIANHLIRFQNGRGKVIQYKLSPGSTNYFQWSQGTLYMMHR